MCLMKTHPNGKSPANGTMAEIVREAVEECGRGLPTSPLKVEPQFAPEGALKPDEKEQVIALRKSLDAKLGDLDAAVRAEAEAHMDDFTLARFSIARDGKQAEAQDMFLTTMRFRADKQVNLLRAELHPNATHTAGTSSHLRHAAVRNHFHAGWGGCARDGSPFFIENMGKLDVASIDRDPYLFELMMDAYACTYLEMAFSSVRVASARSGQMQRATTIVDASGASLSMLSHLRVIKSVAKVGTSYYPEIMKRVLIVNAPWVAAMAWKALAPFLPEQTRKKVSIYSKNFLPQILEEIDASELPAYLGGKRETPNGLPRTDKVPSTLGDELRAAASMTCSTMAQGEATGGAAEPVALS